VSRDAGLTWEDVADYVGECWQDLGLGAHARHGAALLACCTARNMRLSTRHSGVWLHRGSGLPSGAQYSFLRALNPALSVLPLHGQPSTSLATLAA
jgi:hypothetical protein